MRVFRRRATPRPTILAWALATAAGLLTACDDSVPPQAPEIGPAHAMVPDSSRPLRRPGDASTAVVQASAMVLEKASSFVIGVVDTECAAQGNTITLTSPETQTLTTSGCQLSSDMTWPFPGPYPAGTTIAFSFHSGYTGSPGQIQVTGAYPKWTVSFEDGFDNDFNDIVLSVTATPTSPTLTCPASVERGSRVSCVVTPSSARVQSWSFRAGGFSASAPGGDNEWVGDAVRDGTVTAVVVAGGDPETLTASFTVTDRAWGWGPAEWSFQKGAAPLVGTPMPNRETDWLLGWNCTLPDCRRGWIIPDADLGDKSGYDLTPVPTGPNTGLWYVSRAEFFIDRGSNLNPEVLATSGMRMPLTASQAVACASLTPEPDGSVLANWYTFNSVCQNVNAQSIIDAAWLHEGYGSNGNNGHQSLGEAAAAEPRNDPRFQIEALYATNEADLDRAVVQALAGAATRIDRESDRADRGRPGNWPGGTIWVWSFNRSQWTSMRLRAF